MKINLNNATKQGLKTLKHTLDRTQSTLQPSKNAKPMLWTSTERLLPMESVTRC